MNEIYIKTKDLPDWVVKNYFDGKDLITIEELYVALDELSFDYGRLKEDFDDYKKNVEENAIWRTPEEDYGWDMHDYI